MSKRAVVLCVAYAVSTALLWFLLYEFAVALIARFVPEIARSLPGVLQ